MTIKNLGYTDLILIIENDPTDRKMLVDHLSAYNKGWSFTHCNCNDILEFASILEKRKPDLIISEYNLGDHTSEHALKVARDVIPDIPFIVISSQLDKDKAISLIVDDKINDYVSKRNPDRLGRSVLRELESLKIRNRLAKTEEEQKRSLKLLNAINDIATSLLDSESLISISNTITEKLMVHFDFKDCVIYNFNNETNLLTQIAAFGPKKNPDSTINQVVTLKLGEGIVGHVATTLEAEIVNDLQKDKRYLKDLKPNNSEITVPIILENQLIGVIDSEHEEKGFYTQQHLQDLQTIAGLISTKFKAAQELEKSRKAALKLEHSESQLQQISNNIETVVFRRVLYPSGKGELLYVSTKVEDIYEIKPDEVIKDDSLIWNMIHNEDIKTVEKTYEEAIKSGSKYSIDYRIITPSGKLKWIESNGTILKLEDGSVIIDTTNKDITDRVLSQRKIQENESLLRSLTNNIPGVIIRFSLPDGEMVGIIEYISEGCSKVYELTQEEILRDNNSLWSLIFPEDVDVMMPTILESAQELCNWDFSYRIKTKSGKVKYLHGRGTPNRIESEKRVVWDTVIFDETEVNQFKEELKKSNERLLKAQELARIGDWDINLITGETFVSEVVKQIYEVEDDFNIEKGITFYKKGYNRNKIEEVLNRAIEDGINYSEDLIIVSGNGNEKWVRSQGKVEVKDGKSVRLYGTLRDIDDEKRSQIKIKETNNRLFEAQRLAKIGDWSFNPKTNEMIVSPIIKEMHEVNEDYEWDIKTGLNFFKEGINRNRKKYVVQKALDEGIPYDEELLIITNKGNERWMRSIGKPVLEDGETVTLSGTLMDITNEKKLRDSLEENKNQLNAAISVAKLGVWDLNLVTGTNTTNSLYKSNLGYSDEEFENTFEFFLEILHPDDQELIHSTLKNIKNGREKNFDILIRLKHKDGFYRTFQDHGRAMEFSIDGKVTRMIGTILDITEQVELQEKLENSEFRLETAIQGANLGVWDSNIRDQTNVANDRWFEMFEYSRDEVKDSFGFFFSIVRPEDGELIMNEINKIERGEKESFEVVVRAQTKSGEWRTILDKGTALEFDEDGKVIRMIGTHLDITEQEKLRINIENSLKEKTLLLSEIHHRVKNNLAIITGLLDLQTMGSDDDNLKQILGETGRRIKSIANVHELLYNTESFSDIAFDKYIQNLTDSISNTLDTELGTINLDIAKNLSININQAIPLGLLFNELITNSFKYAFGSDKKKNQINIKLTMKDETYTIAYSDSGSGFDRTELDKSNSLGTLLIDTLLRQLEAEFKIETEKGFKINFSFKGVASGAHSNM